MHSTSSLTILQMIVSKREREREGEMPAPGTGGDE